MMFIYIIIKQIFDVVSLLFIFSTVLALTWYIQMLFSRRHFYRMLNNIHGPPAIPVIGHLHLTFGNMRQIFNRIIRICDNYPSPIKLWLGTEVNLLITNPKHMQIILNNPNMLEKHPYYKFLKLDNGLIAQPVPIWKHDRKIINPAFNLKIMESFIETYTKKSKKLIENLEIQSGKGNFNISPFIAQYVMDVLCATALGVDLNERDEKLYQLVKTIQRYEEVVTARIMNRHYWINFIYKFSKLAIEEKHCQNDMKQFIDKIIQNRRQKCTDEMKLNEEQQNIETDDMYANIPKRKILVDLLMHSENENKLSNEQLRDQMLMFFIAGTDTTSIVTSFILMMLGMHPEIQDKVYSEINDIFNGSDYVITHQHLSSMHYTEMVIKETMRLFPPLSFIGRKATKDINLGDVTIPEDVGVILSILTLHRNNNLWPNSMKFDPERFTVENCTKRHPYSFIPFSGGPRNCIGNKFAMLSMKTLLVPVIKKFTIKCPYKTPSDINLRVDMLARPSRGHLVSIENRE